MRSSVPTHAPTDSRFRLTGMLAAVLLVGCGGGEMALMREEVPLGSLVTDPGRYTSYPVRVAGLCVSDSVGTTLFLSREDARNGVKRNGIAITFVQPGVRCDTTFMTVGGDFAELGSDAPWPGVLERAEVDQVEEPTPDTADPPEKEPF